MKKFVSKMMVIACLLGMLGSTLTVTAKADVVKPTQVQNVSKVVSGSGKITLTWDAAKRQEYDSSAPSGYTVYMKEKGGKYRAVKNTKKTECSIKNLNDSVTYYVKVRAYNKSGKKKYYGQYSEVLKFQMQDWEYLANLMGPYIVPSNGHTYKGYSDSFMMGGEKNYNGYTYITDNGDGGGHPFSLNLGGKFSKISFNLGLEDEGYDRDVTFSIYGDNQLVQTVHRAKSDLPTQITLDTTDLYKFQVKSEFDGGAYDYIYVGLSDVKVYY